MTFIPSLSDSQLLLWKKELRSLIKRSGLSQQEVAHEMARIVSIREKKKIAETAFIASLSRFINGKDSAFPGWLVHESERLLPFSEAIGLDSTQKIWNILSSVTGEQREAQENHPAFPQVSLCVEPRFQISIPQIIEQLSDETEIVITGSTGAGKRFAATWLGDRLQYQLGYRPSIVVRHQHLRSSPGSIVLILSDWEVEDVQSLIDMLISSQKLSRSEELQLHQFSTLLNPQWLGFDRRPDAILWMLHDIAHHGIPRSYGAHIRRQNHRDWFRIQKNTEVLSRIGPNSWQEILFFLWSREGLSSRGDLIEKCRQIQPQNFELTRDVLAQQLQKLRSRSKGAREEAFLFLEHKIGQIDAEELVLALVESRRIVEIEDRVGLSEFVCNLSMLAEYLCALTDPVLPLPQFICSQHWWKLLWMMSELGLSYRQLGHMLEDSPQWTQIDRARSIVYWSYISDGEIPDSDLVRAWAICIWAEMQSIFPIRVPFVKQFSDVLVQFSFLRANRLPFLENLEALNNIIAADISIFPQREFVQYRTIASLAPVQHAPKTVSEWRRWSDPTLAWQAVERRAEMGENSAVRLLSEGEGENDLIWQAVPFEKRLQWLGVSESTSVTLYAFQLLLIEAWNPNSTQKELFLQTAERIGFSDVLEWMKRWCAPLFIGQYLHAEKNISETLSQATIDFCIHFEAYSLLEGWLDQLWSWCLSDNQIKGNFISWQNKRVFLADIAGNQDLLYQRLAMLIYAGAGELYHRERPYLMYRLYFEGHRWTNQGAMGDIKERAHQFLLQEGDITLIQEWIDTAPTSDPLMERHLLQDIQKLSKAWRQDKKVLRRQEILRIAALHKPIPRWALSVANKQILREAIWPHWLSPYGSDVLFLIRQMILAASGRNRMWWLRILHRSEPWPVEFVQEIQVWANAENALEWRSRTVQTLSAHSTPWLDAIDMLSLLQDYVLSAEEKGWLAKAAQNLWQNCHSGLDRRTLRHLFSFLELFGEIQFLFTGDWITEKQAFLDFLCPLWFARTKVEVLEKYLHHPSIGERVERYLQSKGNPKATALSVSVFLEGKADRLVDIIHHPDLDSLLTQFVARYPEHQRALVQQLRTIPFVWKEETGRLQSWLRRLEY